METEGGGVCCLILPFFHFHLTSFCFHHTLSSFCSLFALLFSNRISSLPHTLGLLSRLRKLMLSNNSLLSSQNICDCRNLELLRLANNPLRVLQPCLSRMPKLAWISISGTPLALPVTPPMNLRLPSYDLSDRSSWRPLGAGASGQVFAIRWRRTVPAALKLFHALSSDGRPESEVALTVSASAAPGCVRVLAYFPHPRWGLISELLEGFAPLAKPPSFASVSRDVYAPRTSFSMHGATAVLLVVARACAYLHDVLHISHGDLYGHNIMVRQHVLEGSKHVLLSDVRLTDFGAAFRYDRGGLDFQALEARAFGILADELIDRSPPNDSRLSALQAMSVRCVGPHTEQRPRFVELAAMLEGLWQQL